MAKEEVSYKYGIEDLAKETGRAPATLRAWLRKNEIEKVGKGYGWKDSSSLKAQAREITTKGEGGGGAKKKKKVVKKAAAKKRKPASAEASAEA
jgi:hypothetical protein